MTGPVTQGPAGPVTLAHLRSIPPPTTHAAYVDALVKSVFRAVNEAAVTGQIVRMRESDWAWVTRLLDAIAEDRLIVTPEDEMPPPVELTPMMAGALRNIVHAIRVFAEDARSQALTILDAEAATRGGAHDG